MLVPDIFNHNPSAKNLGLEVTDVRLLGTLPDKSCLVDVYTNHGYTLKYKFQLDEAGTATLDMVP